MNSDTQNDSFWFQAAGEVICHFLCLLSNSQRLLHCQCTMVKLAHRALSIPKRALLQLILLSIAEQKSHPAFTIIEYCRPFHFFVPLLFEQLPNCTMSLPETTSGVRSPESSNLKTTRQVTQNRHIIVICGPAGCGKTSNAKHIAEKFGLEFMEGDVVRSAES